MKNSEDRGGCYPPRLKAEVNNILRDLQNSSHRTTAEFMNCFIINSKYFLVLNMLTSKQTSFKTLAYFSGLFQDMNSCFSCRYILRADKIHRAICFAHSCIFSIQFK